MTRRLLLQTTTLDAHYTDDIQYCIVPIDQDRINAIMDRWAAVEQLDKDGTAIRSADFADHAPMWFNAEILPIIAEAMNMPVEDVEADLDAVGYIVLEGFDTIEVPDNTYERTELDRQVVFPRGHVYWRAYPKHVESLVETTEGLTANTLKKILENQDD